MTAQELVAAGLPTVHWVPLLPPDRDDPPYDALLENGVSLCPELDAVLVAPWRLVRNVLGNERDYQLAGASQDHPQAKLTRAELMRAFGPHRVSARVESMRRFADIQVDRLLPTGYTDLETGFTGPFAARVLNDMIGLPATDDDLIADFRRASEMLGSETSSDPDQLTAAELQYPVRRHLARHVRRVKLQRPVAQDLIGDLVHAGLRTDTIVRCALSGWESAEQATRNLLLFVIRDLLSTGTWSRSSTDRCVEESLRRWSPHGTVLRRTTTAVTLGRRRLPAGTRIGLVLGAANLDPTVFVHPREHNPDRAWLDRHLAFGQGLHRCPGATLARTAARIAIDALAQLPKLRLADPEQRQRKAHPFLNGPDRVELVWG